MRNQSITYHGIAIICMMVAMFLFSACSPSHKDEFDRLNSTSYAFHYRNLDSTKVLAERALSLSDDYASGYAEACNNLAFAAIAKMNYKLAKKWLDQVESRSDNQIELLIADIQNMRLCQREARNKEFYSYREKAMSKLRRIYEEIDNLPQRERRRVLYARSEFDIVAATYFYYVQLEKPMLQALGDIDSDELEQDTAQYLNYLYNMGSGGAITQGTPHEIKQAEFDNLIRCYMIASDGNPYPYWQANALQAISEHIQDVENREFLIKNNLPAFQYLNVEQMPQELLAGNFAQRALNIFSAYGDVYQIAGAYRTLAECYWQIKDYNSAASCLNQALNVNKAIFQAPDLVASIREQLSLVYSAVDDKPKSDFNRNAYLDLQEMSRQDRQLEARAAQLDKNSLLLNIMIVAVVGMIILVVVLLYVFDYMKRKKTQGNSMDSLLVPLREWNDRNEQSIKELKEKKEEIEEERNIVRLHIADNKKRNLEQRAKVSLVNSITPFIDRMIHEVDRLADGRDTEEVKQERYQYISELTDKINQYNAVLTSWIQMRQGSLSLRIESFPLQALFDIVAKGKLGFKMKGIQLIVQPTDAVVKADKTLTLFMINTIADNARKFTPQGGKVEISAREIKEIQNSHSGKMSPLGYVEISISDTGKGMDEESLAHVFDRTYTGGHGFGLLNCKGIMDKYKKLSHLFDACGIHAESQLGRGSKFVFTLPCGMKRVMMLLLVLLPSLLMDAANGQRLHKEGQYEGNLGAAEHYADSAYFSNINGSYSRTLQMADSAIYYLNRHYLSLRPNGNYLMVRHPKVGTCAELHWLRDSLHFDYHVILDIRNESAVAALALHKWDLYESNNKVFTQLFRELSSDKTLDDYVRTMQVSETSKTVAVALLILLLLQLPLAYYLLYYRHVLSYRYAVDKVNSINKILLSTDTDDEKLRRIRMIWTPKHGMKEANGSLNEVVLRIEQALQTSIQLHQHETVDLELATDELHRAQYENDKLHISNAVLDNCLSTLKHETMYYPSRIRQLIDSNPSDVASLREIVEYYKQLYTMLSAQAMEQVEGNVRYDAFLIDYLRRMLTENISRDSLDISVEDKHPYSLVRIEYKLVAYIVERHGLLFTPLTSDMKYLLCRQIVREVGEVTNLRGCGILSKPSEDGHLLIEIMLPQAMIERFK